MNFKQKIQTLAAGAVLSSALFHGVAMADTITVSKGDTLWNLSQKHGTTVANLKETNHLTSNTIYIGQKLEVSAKTSSKATEPTKKTPTTTTYVVKKGDTLYKIGKQFGIPYQTIQKWNNLSSSTIRVGQTLTLSATTKPTQSAKVTSTTTVKTASTTTATTKRDVLIQTAKKYIGTPYKWGGTTPSGFDCSGFMYYTLKSQGLVSTRYNVAGYWSSAKKISSPVPGDLVFFQNTYKSGPSHMGVFLGNGQFIHAGSDGVAIDSVNSSYWKKHFLGYGTFF